MCIYKHAKTHTHKHTCHMSGRGCGREYSLLTSKKSKSLCENGCITILFSAIIIIV